MFFLSGINSQSFIMNTKCESLKKCKDFKSLIINELLKILCYSKYLYLFLGSVNEFLRQKLINFFC